MTPQATAVKRACDACHRRKVKCDSGNPCRNCGVAQLGCTYNAIPQKKGPKGSRAKVISELRETQRQTSLAARVQNRINGIAPLPNNSFNPSSGLLSPEFVKECVGFFFAHCYGKAPILEQRGIEATIPMMEQNRSVYCLLTALCAYVLLQPGMRTKNQGDVSIHMNAGGNVVAAQILLEESQRVRKGSDHMEAVDVNQVATNYFLASAFLIMEHQDRAWIEVRDATTMINLANWHMEETYATLDAVEATRARRLYWLFYVMERSFAFSRNRPVTLDASIASPTLNDDPSDPLAHTLHGFLTLVEVYRDFSYNTLREWSTARRSLNGQYLTTLSAELNSSLEQLVRQDVNALDANQNQAWLSDMLWRMTPTQSSPQGGVAGFEVSSEAATEVLHTLSSQFAEPCMEILNRGLMKTFLQTLVNMLNLAHMIPRSHTPYIMGPREHLDEVIGAIALVRSGAGHYLPLLFHKVGEVLPRVSVPLVEEQPVDMGFSMPDDLFDGFGDTGVVAMTPDLQMAMEAQRASMSMDTPIQGQMQLSPEQHTSPHSHFGNHSSPPMQLHIDSQSTASMVKIEPRQQPKMQMSMDSNYVNNQQPKQHQNLQLRQHPQLQQPQQHQQLQLQSQQHRQLQQHQLQQQQFQQQQQIPMQMMDPGFSMDAFNTVGFDPQWTSGW